MPKTNSRNCYAARKVYIHRDKKRSYLLLQATLWRKNAIHNNSIANNKSISYCDALNRVFDIYFSAISINTFEYSLHLVVRIERLLLSLSEKNWLKVFYYMRVKEFFEREEREWNKHNVKMSFPNIYSPKRKRAFAKLETGQSNIPFQYPAPSKTRPFVISN